MWAVTDDASLDKSLVPQLDSIVGNSREERVKEREALVMKSPDSSAPSTRAPVRARDIDPDRLSQAPATPIKNIQDNKMDSSPVQAPIRSSDVSNY
jgi:hypothetical protein